MYMKKLLTMKHEQCIVCPSGNRRPSHCNCCGSCWHVDTTDIREKRLSLCTPCTAMHCYTNMNLKCFSWSLRCFTSLHHEHCPCLLYDAPFKLGYNGLIPRYNNKNCCLQIWRKIYQLIPVLIDYSSFVCSAWNHSSKPSTYMTLMSTDTATHLGINSLRYERISTGEEVWVVV